MIIIKELQERLKTADPTFKPQNYEAVGAMESNQTGPAAIKTASAVATSQRIDFKPFVRKGMQ